MALLVIAEAGLRLAGRPSGKYAIRFLASGLYQPHLDMEVTYGPVPYRLVTNALGMRSPPVRVKKPPGVVRIIALGDSITDGFFVDNTDTYPWQLQGILQRRGHNVEVLNAAAAGGGSIDKELGILRGLHALEPDIAVVTFCTNDIANILGRTREELLNNDVLGDGYLKRVQAAPEPSLSLLQLVIVHSAIGETLANLWIRARADPSASTGSGEGAQHERNAEIFLRRFAETDGLVLGDRFAPEVSRAVESYLAVLGALERYCTERRIELVFVYFPAYSEVYQKGSPRRMRDILRTYCKSRTIHFLDLTPELRKAGERQVLHFAPADFHPNQAGLRTMATSIADFLVGKELVKPRR